MVDYFTLEDLWEYYSESSAYGLAVPLRLDQSTITQHFVPYLSAIQIYTSVADAIPTRFLLISISLSLSLFFWSTLISTEIMTQSMAQKHGKRDRFLER